MDVLIYSLTRSLARSIRSTLPLVLHGMVCAGLVDRRCLFNLSTYIVLYIHAFFIALGGLRAHSLLGAETVRIRIAGARRTSGRRIVDY